MLTRHRDSDGRRSRFDPTEVERLAGRARHGGRAGALEVVVDTRADAHRRGRAPVLPRARRDGARPLPVLRAGRRTALGVRRRAHSVARARGDGDRVRGRAGRAARGRQAGRPHARHRRGRGRDRPAARRPPPRRGPRRRPYAHRDARGRAARALGAARCVDRGATLVPAGGRAAEPRRAQHAGRGARAARRPRARRLDAGCARRRLGLGRSLSRRPHRAERARRRAARRERRRGRGAAGLHRGAGGRGHRPG